MSSPFASPFISPSGRLNSLRILLLLDSDDLLDLLKLLALSTESVYAGLLEVPSRNLQLEQLGHT